MNESLEQLMNHFARNGTVEWIGVRPEKKKDLVSVQSVMIDPSTGIAGDHYSGRSGKRQVTLIQAEHLPVIASLMQLNQVTPDQLRRNIVVHGINLLALKDNYFLLGDAVLEYTGLCHPCSRMESTLGNGGYNAMRGHGGITARIVRGGSVSVGDKVIIVPQPVE